MLLLQKPCFVRSPSRKCPKSPYFKEQCWFSEFDIFYCYCFFFFYLTLFSMNAQKWVVRSTDWKLNLGSTKKMLFFDLIGSFAKRKYYRQPSKTDMVFDRAGLKIVFRIKWFIVIFKFNTTTILRWEELNRTRAQRYSDRNPVCFFMCAF